MNIKLSCNALVLPALLLFGSWALATVNDAKILPGSACQPTSSSEAFSTDGIGRILNPSPTVILFVDCPIVRDVRAANATDGLDVGWVRVEDNHSLQNISCALLSENKLDNNAIDFVTDASAGEGVQQLDFSDLASSVQGYYHYLCSIPPTEGGVPSYIKAYYAGEEGGNP